MKRTLSIIFLTWLTVSGFAATAPSLSLNYAQFPYLSAFFATNVWRTYDTNINVLVVGDSLGGNKLPYIESQFMQTVGFTGRGMNNRIVAVVGGGATETTDLTLSPYGNYVTLDAAGENVIYNIDGSASQMADRMHVFYYKQTGQGHFSIDTSVGGAAFVNSVADVDAGAGTATLHLDKTIADRTTSPGMYRVRVNWISGTVRILGVLFEHHLGKGANIINLTRGNTTWQDFNTCDENVLSDLAALLDVKLCIVQNTDDASQWNTYAPQYFGKLFKNNPDMDVVIISPNPFEDPTQETANLAQINAMRSLSQRSNWVFFDEHELFKSFTRAKALGMMQDADVHPLPTGRAFATRQMFQQTGLNAVFQTEQSARPQAGTSVTGGPFPGFVEYNSASDATFAVLSGPGKQSVLALGDWGWAYGNFNRAYFQIATTASAVNMYGASGVNFLLANRNAIEGTWMGIPMTNGVATPVSMRVGNGAGPTISRGTGTPEGAVTAPVGSLFMRTDGGAGTSLYVKESGAGNTGWVGK